MTKTLKSPFCRKAVQTNYVKLDIISEANSLFLERELICSTFCEFKFFQSTMPITVKIAENFKVYVCYVSLARFFFIIVMIYKTKLQNKLVAKRFGKFSTCIMKKKISLRLYYSKPQMENCQR